MLKLKPATVVTNVYAGSTVHVSNPEHYQMVPNSDSLQTDIITNQPKIQGTPSVHSLPEELEMETIGKTNPKPELRRSNRLKKSNWTGW